MIDRKMGLTDQTTEKLDWLDEPGCWSHLQYAQTEAAVESSGERLCGQKASSLGSEIWQFE